MTERIVGRRKDKDVERVEPASRSSQPAKAAKSKSRTAPVKPKPPVRADDRAAAYTKKTIALVYDFDGTLSPRPMQEYSFLPKLGIEPHKFWQECADIAREQQADPLITYMHLMYKKAKEKGLRVDRADLVAQGREVELFPGVEEWFDAISEYVALATESKGVELRHYLVSSGLTEIIEGTKIFKRFHNVFASEYWFDAYDLPFPKRVITDTGKTQYLFRINKGIEDLGRASMRICPRRRGPFRSRT